MPLNLQAHYLLIITNPSSIIITSHADTAIGGLGFGNFRSQFSNINNDLAASTRQSYHAGESYYIQFCQQLRITPMIREGISENLARQCSPDYQGYCY